jgi:hypothetical protein
VRKSVRFRLSEIEQWIDSGGGDCPDFPADNWQGDLFNDEEAGKAGETEAGTGDDGETAGTGDEGQAGEMAANEAGAEGTREACCPPAANSSEEKV